MLLRVLCTVVCFGLCGVWLFVLLVATAQPLYAYVDPGSGLLFIQAAGSTLAGLGYLLRRRIRMVLRRLMRQAEETEEGTLR